MLILWNTRKITDMSFLFRKCSKLKSLPDISFWITNKVKDMHEIFLGCSSLESLPEMLMIYQIYFIIAHL